MFKSKAHDRAITALIEAGKITEDDAYPSNDVEACYAAQDAILAVFASYKVGQVLIRKVDGAFAVVKEVQVNGLVVTIKGKAYEGAFEAFVTGYEIDGDFMIPMLVESVKQGEFVKRKFDAKGVFMREEYDRETKRYALDSCDDISKQVWVKKGTVVIVGFTY